MSPGQWAGARNVLCVRLDSLGDVLMCTPAMRALVQSHVHAQPARSLTLLTSPGAAAAAPFIPELDAVIGYAAPWVKHGAPQEGGCEAGCKAGSEERPDAAFIETLAARRFDAAVIFTSFSQSALPAALLCCLAGIPLRLAHCRENPYRLLSDWIPDPEPQSLIRHEVRRGLDLVAAVGCVADSSALSFAVRERDLAAVRRRLAGAGGGANGGARGDNINNAAPLVLLHPGASAPSRRYPAERWADVAHALSRRIDCRLVLTGEAHEAPLLERIRAACQAQGVAVRSLAGQFDLGQLGAAIRLASVLVSNNTGPAHMAAAIGTPVVDLYALTNPQHTPWQVESRVLFHEVPCRFCYKSACPQGHHDCLAKVEPGRVADAVCSLLDSSVQQAVQARRLG